MNHELEQRIRDHEALMAAGRRRLEELEAQLRCEQLEQRIRAHEALMAADRRRLERLEAQLRCELKPSQLAIGRESERMLIDHAEIEARQHRQDPPTERDIPWSDVLVEPRVPRDKPGPKGPRVPGARKERLEALAAQMRARNATQGSGCRATVRAIAKRQAAGKAAHAKA
jgi:hypothetical protein